MGRLKTLSASLAYSDKIFEGETDENPTAGPVAYDSADWGQVLFQCFGSTWPNITKWCLLNVVLYAGVSTLKDYAIIDLGISNQSHTLAGMIVSFLLVSRVNTGLNRYMACRGHINVMYRETREFIQTALILSHRKKNDDDEACEWRNEMAYRTLVLLRTAIAVVEYPSKELPGWKCPELSGYEKLYSTPCDLWKRNSLTSQPGDDYTNTMRIPFRIAYLLRKTISEQEERLDNPFHVTQETKLYTTVDSFMNGYYGMRKFITTPVPFPLIQMTRTLVLIYIYTLPLILINNKERSMIWGCLSVFILTYGFLGLELVAIELDDPFGDDENDFNTLAFARMVFEDTYLMMSEADGEKWADALRNKMNCPYFKGNRRTSKSGHFCLGKKNASLLMVLED